MNEENVEKGITWWVVAFGLLIALWSLLGVCAYLKGGVEYIPARVVSDVYIPTEDVGGYPMGYGSTIPAHWYGRVVFNYQDKAYSHEGNILPFRESRDTQVLSVASHACVVLEKNGWTDAVTVSGVFAMSC